MEMQIKATVSSINRYIDEDTKDAKSIATMRIQKNVDDKFMIVDREVAIMVNEKDFTFDLNQDVTITVSIP